MGFIKILILTIITMYIVNILLMNLGKEEYGVIALFTSLNQYISLFLVAISGTIFRFVSLEYHKNNKSENINKYYSTSFFSMLFLSILAFIILYAITPMLKGFVNSPNLNSSEIELFFILSISAFLISNLTSVFFVSGIIKHQFYLNDLSNIVAKSIQLLLVLILVNYLVDLTLYTYGLTLIFYSVFYLIFSIIISKVIMPELIISMKYFSIKYLKNMLEMGTNVLLNNLGIMLYTGTDLIIVNIFLGTATVTEYSISLQLAFFIAMVGTIFSRLFNSSLSKFIANYSSDFISSQILMLSKIFLIYIGIFFILLVVFSKKILFFWLGFEYIYLYSILILLALYQLLHQSTVLFSMYFTLVNKLKTPLKITIIAGITNIILSILFLKFTSYGVYGIIFATIITVLFKTVIFNSFYTAYLLKMKISRIYKTFFPSFIFIIVYSWLCFILVDSINTSNLYLLLVSLLTIVFVYLFLAYYLFFTKKEQVQVLHMTKLYYLVKKK